MPEIPEIETMCRHLRHAFNGRTIAAVIVKREKSLNVPAMEFTSVVTGQQVISVDRRAKVILIRLWTHTLTIHLMLEGYVKLLSNCNEQLNQCSAAFQLDNGMSVAFFRLNLGYLHLFTTTDYTQIDDLAHIGPEPLSVEFTLSAFLTRIQSRKGMIKPLLLDQQFLAGIGNVYSNEILFCSRILPERKVAQMETEDLHRIYNCMQRILHQAIELGGVYDIPFSSSDTITGQYTPYLQVAYRTDEPCYVCGHLIQTKRVGGRNAFYCPQCQR